MQLKIITLAFNSLLKEFDDSEFAEFAANKDVRSIAEYFFVAHDIPYLALVIRYSLSDRPAVATESRSTKTKTDDAKWKMSLEESDMGLFNILRDWRYKRAKKEGLPPYVLFTNKQLVQIVRSKPQSLTSLGSIEGFGKAKMEKYGRDILEITGVSLGETHQQEGENIAERQ